MKKLFSVINEGQFGSPEEFKPLIDSIKYYGDYFVVSGELNLFLDAPKKLENVFGHHEGDSGDVNYLHEWAKKYV
ncbi:GPH1 [Candida jiufengensis]|uniref:GPH1 n=1 Tax=Candida jiufengensis TaxID=497108 RepID=UPI00222596A7|nr:GPH1 [Candida jiufengensis]KAI5949289.1 GPH1 [Candida jiufengensis]